MKHIIELEEDRKVIHKVTIDIPDEHKKDVDEFLDEVFLSIIEPTKNLSEYIDALNEKCKVISVNENVSVERSDVSFNDDYPYRLSKD